MPLSVTVRRSFTRPRVARDARTSSRTLPRSVNFTALSIRFSIAARNRAASPMSISGRSAATVTSTVRPLVSTRAASVSASASIRRRGRKACCWSVSPPASALAASIANVVSAARCSAPVLMLAAQRRSRSPRLELASNSPSARMPVSEVRMSCANAASAASVVRVTAPHRSGRRRERFAADFFFSLVRTMAAPRSEWHGGGPNKTSDDWLIQDHALAAEPDHAPNVLRARAVGAQVTQAFGQGRLRQLAALGIENEPVMVIDRLRQAEQRLQQAMDAGRPEQILAAHHVADALKGVVQRDGEVIAGRDFLARDDDVAPHHRRRGDGTGLAVRPGAGLGPGQHAGLRHRCIDGEPQRVTLAGIDPALSLGHRQFAGAARIKRAAVGIARPAAVAVALDDQRGDLAAALETRIEQRQRVELEEGRFVIGEMLALPPHRLLPGNAEPLQI